ncbi:MAG: helix-turn-helix domain-containing protein [Endomicrobiales bacterium]
MPEKILLVDDDEDFRTEFRESLEEYDVLEVDSGQKALDLLRKPNEIDLVILDVVMPGLSGTEVLKEMRRIAPNLGIIMLTGYGSKDTAIEALRSDADDYIEKPMDIDKIKQVIDKVLDARKAHYEVTVTGAKGKVERTKRFAERNCNKRTSLKDAAAAIFLSPKYLSRIFKQNTGTRFSDFRLQIKMKEAKSLLEETGYNINQIAEKLGYQNTESFIRMFKKLTGDTPTQYRERASAGRTVTADKVTV